jgi:hypothetical protein
VGAPPRAAPPPAPEEDFGDIEVEASAAARPAQTAPAPVAPPAPALDDLDVDVDTEPAAAHAPIELPEEREPAEPELAPMHAFVPPAAEVGHRPEAAPAAAKDGGEALLREALSRASRDVIERVVWEVVPQLAETIIRENLDRLVKQRQE